MNLFIRTTSQNIEFQKLVELLDGDLSIRDGEEHPFYAQFNKIDNIRYVILCIRDGKAIGCGAIKEYDKEKMEIKRMYVLTEFRRTGIAFQLLRELEKWALELKYNYCILETGKKQPEAINLYLKGGYKITNNYGQYQTVENRICMSKSIQMPSLDT